MFVFGVNVGFFFLEVGEDGIGFLIVGVVEFLNIDIG